MEHPPLQTATPTRPDARDIRREMRVEHEEREVKLMASFHVDRLMEAAQDALRDISPDEETAMAEWNEYLSKETESTKGFQRLIEDMREALQPAKPGAEKRLRQVNLEAPAWREKRDGWKASISQDLIHLGIVKPEAQVSVLGEVDPLLEASAATMTAYAVLDEINAFKKARKGDLLDPKQRPEALHQLEWFLAQEFGCAADEAALYVKVAVEELTPSKKPSLQDIAQVAERIWTKYGAQSVKTQAARMVVGSLINEQLREIIRQDEKFYLRDGEFRLDLFMAFIGVHVGANVAGVVERATDLEMRRSVKYELNRRLVDAMFFRRWEFAPAVNDVDMMEAIEKGNRAIEWLMNKGFARMIPALHGAVLATHQLTTIHPLMAMTICAGGVATIMAEKKIGERNRQEEDQSERARKRMSAEFKILRTETEALKVSDRAGDMASLVREGMNASEGRAAQPVKQRVVEELVTRLPAQALAAAVGVVGKFLQRTKGMTGEEVVRQMKVASRLVPAVRDIAELVETDFTREIQNFRKMEAVLGSEDDLDSPDGSLEQARVPFSTLPHRTITFRNLWFRDVLKGVTEEIEEGTFALLVGKSGTGKSTILRHITDILPTEYGEVLIGGVPVSGVKKFGPDSLYASLAYANQQPRVFPDKSVRENIMMWIPHLERTDDEICELLDGLGLQKFSKRLDEPLGYASGGETLRMGLARALIKRPKILLLDEPTGPLDPETADDTWALLEKMHERDPGMTIVCVTHSEKVIDEFDASASGRKQVIRMGEIQPGAKKVEQVA